MSCTRNGIYLLYLSMLWFLYQIIEECLLKFRKLSVILLLCQIIIVSYELLIISYFLVIGFYGIVTASLIIEDLFLLVRGFDSGIITTSSIVSRYLQRHIFSLTSKGDVGYQSLIVRILGVNESLGW